jgi:repressor LexA
MPRPISTALSDAHRNVLRAIARFEGRGEPAFLMDLVEALKLKGESSLAPTLQRMARNGLVALKGGGQGRSRIVRLTLRGRLEAALGGLPLLGSIPAGPLEEAVAQSDTILDERELLPYRPGDFLLQVKGDSMIGDGILEGDKVLLRPNVQVQHGEIAAVLVGDAHEATLKRVLLHEGTGKVTLRASNRRYVDRFVDAEELKIAGVFRGLVRSPKGHSLR